MDERGEAPEGLGQGQQQDPDDLRWSVSSAELLKALSTPEGVFWADHIKTLYDRPAARLEFARQYLPLPGAFREAQIATRALIRQARKAGEDPRPLLEELYRLAVLNFYLHRRERIDGLPAWNAVDKITDEELEGLRFRFEEIGYEVVDTLKPTDRKWLVEAFGEPDSHQDPREVFREPFESGVRRFRAEQERIDADFQALMREIPLKGPRSGCAGSLVFLGGLAGAGALLFA